MIYFYNNYWVSYSYLTSIGKYLLSEICTCIISLSTHRAFFYCLCTARCLLSFSNRSSTKQIMNWIHLGDYFPCMTEHPCIAKQHRACFGRSIAGSSLWGLLFVSIPSRSSSSYYSFVWMVLVIITISMWVTLPNAWSFCTLLLIWSKLIKYHIPILFGQEILWKKTFNEQNW